MVKVHFRKIVTKFEKVYQTEVREAKRSDYETMQHREVLDTVAS